ncbi:hypothetical protein [Fusibacter sp. JL216-2]|uniref:hypothetical protein n=1 Tax=Fusibacter sp. JL216-2 TaxID=3071453 RepID=UPI003D337BC5
MPSKQWFKLDTAGKMYSSIKSSRATTLFRLSADLKKNVDPDILQLSLDHIIERFPYFNVNLRRGIFWYYFDKNESHPRIEKETYYPCMYMKIKKKGIHPFRVLYYNKKVSVEFSHIITDGAGAVTFLRALLFEYYRLLGFDCDDDTIFKYGQEPHPEEVEDAFGKHYDENLPMYRKKVDAFHFPFRRDKKGVYNVVTGILPVENLLVLSRSHGVSLTEFLSAVYFDAIQTLIENENYKKKPIVLNIPVNLRRMLGSKTMRNFFISVTPMIDPRLGHYTFDEILKYVHYFMKITVDEKYVRQQIRQSVMSEKTLFLRVVPLFIKDMLMPFIYKMYGEGNYTTGFSNVGAIRMPPALEDQIDRFELYPPPSIGNTLKVTTVSYKENLYISFGSLTRDRRVEQIYFSKLREMGVPVRIETNR